MFLCTLLCVLLLSFKGIYLQENETDYRTLILEMNNLDISNENNDTENEEPNIHHKFVGISHNLNSGNVYIVDSNIIFIENFNYDGLSPDAHFLLGKSELNYDNGVIIPDENGSLEKLEAYHDEYVILHTDENFYEYDWLGVWCSLDKELIGYVLLNESVSDLLAKETDKAQLKKESVNSETGELHVQPKFIGVSHELSSEYVCVLDNDTIFIENFSYDGLSPDAHFLLGTGELIYDNGILTPDEKGKLKKLKSYHSVDIVLRTEVNVYDYDWLGVWCSLEKELIGYVLLKADESVSARIIITSNDAKPKKEIFQDTNDVLKNEEPMRILSQFLNTSHGIKSGNVTIINDTTIHIPSFYYDGKGFDVNFCVGKGSEPSEDGFEIHFANNDSLPKSINANIVLLLPEEITVNDIEWLSVWDITYKKSYGIVMIHSEIKQTYVQIAPLTPDKSFHFGIHSGPIIIVDTRAIFITNLHYNGKAPDAHFWAGSGDKGIDENGHLLFDENNSTKPLSQYSGVDIYIILPENVNIRQIKYIGIWSSSLKSGLGYSNVTENLSSLPEANGLYQYKNDKYIARLPKCCPRNKVKTAKGCINRITSTFPMIVYEGNMSFFNDEPIENIIFEPYIHQPNCGFGMFRMDLSEEFYLLTDGLLILPDGGIINKDRFCYDVSQIQIEEDVWSWNETIFMCFEGDHPPEFLNPLIVSCIYISSLFLIVTSIIFIVNKKARAERGTNVVGYTSMMSLSFGCLATARILHIDGLACTVLGYIYQYFIVSSFVWLLCLSADIFYQVRNFEKNYYEKRYYVFAGFAITLPIIAVIISIFINNSVPSKYVKPTFGYEPCWFRSDKKVFFYYLPITVSIICNFILISLTWMKMKKLQHLPIWRVRSKGIKNVFRSCYLILGIMTMCWTGEILAFYFETNSGLWIAIDVIDSLQGVFVFLVFVMHDPVIKILKDQFCVSKRTNECVNLYDVPTRPPSDHGVLLSRLQHAESEEDLCCIPEYSNIEKSILGIDTKK